jgi:hypothetical protein
MLRQGPKTMYMVNIDMREYIFIADDFVVELVIGCGNC